MNHKTILKTLPSLSKRELEEIETNIHFLLKMDKAEFLRDDNLAQFYSSLTKGIDKVLGTESVPFHFYLKKNNSNKISKLKDTETFITSYFNTLSSKENIKVTCIQTITFYDLYTSISLNYLQKYNIPVSIDTLCNIVNKFPSLLNEVFPMYVQSALLVKSILRK